MAKKIILGIICLLVVAGLAFAYISINRSLTSQQQSSTTIEKKNESATNKNESTPNFTSVYQEDDVPLNQVANYQAVKAKYGLQLTASQEKFLDQNKFLLIDYGNTSFKPWDNFDQMLEDFDSMGGGDIYDRKPEDTKLITPDIALHAYHKFFELTLEQLEKRELSQALSEFLVNLHGNLATAARNNSGYIAERYRNLAAQIILARVLLENQSPAKPDYFEDPAQETAYYERDKTIDSAQNATKILAKYSADLTPELIGKIQVDLDKIYAANEVGSSPLFQQYNDDLRTDYTQFTPRSHYAKSSVLRAYFRAMMYLGRSSYFLKKDIGITDFNLLAKQFAVRSRNGVAPLDSWTKIMTATGFYAGPSDDLTYHEWRNFEANVLGPNLSDSDLTSAASIQKLAQNLNQLRLPKLLSDVVVTENIFFETKADLLRQSLSCRIFGQRFTFDAWVLNDLTAGQEKTDIRLPSTPSALFLPAAMGDRQAKDHIGDFLKKDAGFSSDDIKGFFTKLNQKQSDIYKIKKAEWFASMGSAWLYVLGSLTHPFGEDYPRYMRTTAFLDKQIQTFLGSYAELKHDTLLYTKQSYAEKGSGDDERPIPPVVKGFVEPNPDFWQQLIELLDRTDQFFEKNHLLTDRTPLARLREFREIVGFYSDIAKKELQGQSIHDDAYEKLRRTGLSFMVQPFDTEDIPDENSGKVALIADIHTDALKGRILYEATGRPYLMLAVVANEQTPRVVASLVYNHYEFTKNLGARLTDEDWRNWVYHQTGNLPPKNFWYQSLLVK